MILCLGCVQPEQEGATVLVHNSSGFDAQLVMEYFLSKDVLGMKNVKAPLMRGQKILACTIMNDIKIIDSYAFVSQPLSKFPKTFDLDENMSKVFFPHTLNRPEFWGYVGPIPDIKYFEPDYFSESKRAELIAWHKEQVENEVMWNFQKEMLKYCEMNVQILREGMEKIRDIFKNLTDLDGNYIGIDPFNYVTIASACFDGVFRGYFLQPETVCVVPAPTKDKYSVSQIMWLDYVMRTQGICIQTAVNGGEALLFQGINGRMYGVDGYCVETNIPSTSSMVVITMDAHVVFVVIAVTSTEPTHTSTRKERRKQDL